MKHKETSKQGPFSMKPPWAGQRNEWSARCLEMSNQNTDQADRLEGFQDRYWTAPCIDNSCTSPKILHLTPVHFGMEQVANRAGDFARKWIDNGWANNTGPGDLFLFNLFGCLSIHSYVISGPSKTCGRTHDARAVKFSPSAVWTLLNYPALPCLPSMSWPPTFSRLMLPPPGFLTSFGHTIHLAGIWNILST